MSDENRIKPLQRGLSLITALQLGDLMYNLLSLHAFYHSPCTRLTVGEPDERETFTTRFSEDQRGSTGRPEPCTQASVCAVGGRRGGRESSEAELHFCHHRWPSPPCAQSEWESDCPHTKF